MNFDLRMLPSDSEGSLSTYRMARKSWGRLRYSEAFKKSTLAECRQRGLEGIVSKKNHAPYKIG